MEGNGERRGEVPRQSFLSSSDLVRDREVDWERLEPFLLVFLGTMLYNLVFLGSKKDEIQEAGDSFACLIPTL